MTPGRSRSSDPFGPATVMWRSAIVTVTPLGTGIGDFPIRLIDSSPHVAEDFAADALFTGLAIGQETAAGGDDGDAETSEHAGDLVGRRVHAEAGLAHAAQARDRALTLGRVLHRDGQDATGSPRIVGDLVALDVALALKDGGERLLLLRGRHANLVVHRDVGVAHAGEHVGDRVGHHRALTSSPTRFRDTGDLAGMDELAKADAAEP